MAMTSSSSSAAGASDLVAKGGDSTDPATPRLLILAGVSQHDCTVQIPVNDDTHPVFIESKYAFVRLVYRVRNYKGHGIGSEAPIENCPYFVDHPERKRLFSIQMQLKFKQDFLVDDILFGCFFEKPVFHPPMVWLPLQLATFIDPTFGSDIHSPKPWFASIAITSMNAINVKACPTPAATSATPHDEIFGKWVWGGKEKELEEDHALLLQNHGGTSAGILERKQAAASVKVPSSHKMDSFSARRKFFTKKQNRTGVFYSKDHVYNMEVYSPFVDWNTFQVNMAGVSIGMQKYLNDQAFHYVFKSKSLDESLFCLKMETAATTPS
ncbi:hypothetical protein DFJ73DRAFT_832763 [Zopfochytrium polystomum]|nr:hypothetical protein DFJ73DRAFT_832763 [Zopfochytrium polystomum]